MASINKTRYALLGLLTFRPMSGYDLKKLFEKSLNYFWRESYGQIYPMLKNLEKEGLTEGHPDREPGKREKIVYALNPKGREAFKDWLMEKADLPRERNELLLKLFFGRHCGEEVTIRRLRTAREEYAQQLSEFEQLEKMLRFDYADDPDQPYWLMSLDYGLRMSRTLIAWCDDSLATLNAGGNREELERSASAGRS